MSQHDPFGRYRKSPKARSFKVDRYERRNPPGACRSSSMAKRSAAAVFRPHPKPMMPGSISCFRGGVAMPDPLVSLAARVGRPAYLWWLAWVSIGAWVLGPLRAAFPVLGGSFSRPAMRLVGCSSVRPGRAVWRSFVSWPPSPVPPLPTHCASAPPFCRPGM